MKNGLVAVVIGVLAAHAVMAESPGSQWQRVQELKPGRQVRVARLDASVVAGKLLRVSGVAIAVKNRGGEISIELSDVYRVEVRSGYKRTLHALAGAGIGAALGLAILFGMSDESAFYTALAALPVISGGLAGAGAAIPGYSTVYSR